MGSRRIGDLRDHMIGRNDPCPCGSGKKYKRCHGALEAQGETGIRAALRIHKTPDGKSVPVIGWAPLDEEAWATIREQLDLGQEHGLLVPMDNPDHWVAESVGIHLRQMGAGVPQWSLTTSPRKKDSSEPGLWPPETNMDGNRSLWRQEWQVSLSLADMVKWVEALHGWKSVIIAPYDPHTMEFLPFGFQIWVPGHNLVVEPLG